MVLALLFTMACFLTSSCYSGASIKFTDAKLSSDINRKEKLYQGCPENCPQGELPPRVRVRVGDQFSSGAVVLEPYQGSLKINK